MTQPVKIGTLLTARWIIPVEPAETVLSGHAIAIDKGMIIAILPIEEANAQFDPIERIALDNHTLIPGLVNLHTHAAMTLMRGLADDLPLMEWLNNHIWPTESQHVSADFVFDGTRLACAEMISGGITCFNDMYFFPASTADATLTSGMRAALGMIVIDFPSAYASDMEDYLSKGLALRDRYQQHPQLSFCFAPHAPYTVSDKAFSRVLTYAEQLNLPIHMHLHETQDEIKISIESYGVRPIERLHELGLLSPNLIAVHMTQLTDDEIQLMAQQGCNIAHCPSSNMKLANGFSPIAAFLAQNVNVGLGTDSAASNNRLDMFEEMRLAALLAKAVSGQTDVMTAHKTLQMGTLAGARALGIDHITGSLAVGKAADITAVDFSDLNLMPCYDPVSHLIYAAGREQVSHVWVNGKILLNDGQLTTLDKTELQQSAAFWQQRIGTTNTQ